MKIPAVDQLNQKEIHKVYEKASEFNRVAGNNGYFDQVSKKFASIVTSRFSSGRIVAVKSCNLPRTHWS